MGQLFGQGLTVPNSAITDPTTGQTSIGKPSDVLGATAGPIAARANAQETANIFGTPNQAQPLPFISTPSATQAATAGAIPGSANVLSPGLNKAGKLAVLLNSGLQGALAGRAANEQATVASGGRRSGGAGMGFEAGYQLPWQRAGLPLGLEREQAQTELLRAQSQMVPTQYGLMPAALARFILPAQIRGEAEQGAAKTRAGATVQSADINAQGRIGAAEVGQRFKAVPGVGLFDTQSRQVVPGTAQNITITPEIAQDYQLPNEFVGKPMNVGQLASLERAMNQQVTVASGAQGPALVTKTGPNAGQTKPLGLGSPAMGGIVPVAADPNNPGNVTYAPKTQAVGQVMASPQSAPTQAARSTLKSATSGPIATQITAFQTALQHADLLQTALTAISNGDERTLNSIKNRFKTEFGSSDVTNFRTIAQVYSDEIQKMISGGHITEGEQKVVQSNLPANASPQQILGALQAYKSLAQSKMNILQQQVQRGQQGQANFPANNAPPPRAKIMSLTDFLNAK